ncbi:hypothetical protein AF53_02897 [Serratia marcescens BIDMC 80]|nr:hypothetical protein AF53_02897 [Serratia marcescens BIDMC 80]
MMLSRMNARLQQLAVLLPLLWGAERARADEGVPALLQFAEQYRAPQVPDAPAKAPGVTAQPNTAWPTTPVTLSDSLALRRTLKARETQLAKQQALLQRQENELATLRQSLATETARHQQTLKVVQAQVTSPRKEVDWAPLQKLVSGLRQAASGLPDEQRATALITEARAAAERERLAVQQAQDQVKALKTQLKALRAERKNKRTALTASQEKEKTALTAQLAASETQLTALKTKTQDMQVVSEQKEATLSALRQENARLQQQQMALTEQAGKAETDLAKQTQALHQLQTDVDILRTRAKWLVKPETLSKPAGQQAYAAGVSLGRDVLSMLHERKGWGVNTDQQTLLAGIVDTFAGQYQLTTDVLARALEDSEAAVNTARSKTAAAQHKKGEAFVADFKKQKGVKQSPAGFWYRVDYAGDGPLRDTDIVDVVVKETLTDGTVIQDMALSGNVLSQPLKAYPPLFREAIGYLKNHGSLTLVVPPELAYGEEGYPPKVPPNATMVYELRIDNSKGAPEI